MRGCGCWDALEWQGSSSHGYHGRLVLPMFLPACGLIVVDQTMLLHSSTALLLDSVSHLATSFLPRVLTLDPGPDGVLAPEDRDAFAAVLPNATLLDSDFTFYLHLKELFRAASATHHEVRTSQLALSVAPPGVDTSELWHRMIKGSTELGAYDDAYGALTASPYDKL